MSETKKHREFWIPKSYENEFHSGIHVIEYGALLEEKQKTKELLNTIVKFKEYFSAIESGEYNNNRRPSPLRKYENVLQLQANELIKKYGDV